MYLLGNSFYRKCIKLNVLGILWHIFSHHTRQFFVPTQKALQFSMNTYLIFDSPLLIEISAAHALHHYRNNCTYVWTEALYSMVVLLSSIEWTQPLSFRKKTNNWASTVAGVLSSGCPQFFKSGQKEFNKETGWWALQENVAPAVKFSEQGLFLLYLFIEIFLNENNKKILILFLE